MEEEKILQEQIANAPDKIKELLSSKSWLNIVSQVVSKNNLSSEQAIALENEVLFVLLGMELKSDLQTNIINSVGVDTRTAQSITSSLNDRLFKDIGDLLPKQSEEGRELPVVAEEHVPLVVEKKAEPPANLPTAQALPKVEVTPPNESIPELRTMKTDAMNAVVESKKQEAREAQQPLTPVNRYPDGKDPYREPISDNEQ